MNDPIGPRFMRFGPQERILFFKRLAMLLRSGVPLSHALSMLDEHHRTKTAAHIHGSIVEDVSRGLTLSIALARFRTIFGDLAVDVVGIGERSGELAQNLAYLAEELKKKDALRKKVIGALMYPAIIFSATVAIALMLTVYIFPKITPVFQGLGHKLPFSTRMLITLSGFLIRHGAEIFFVCIGGGIAAAFIIRNRRVKRFADQISLRTPVFGRLARAYHAGNATRTLSLLLKADMRVVEALEIASHGARNALYRGSLSEMARNVARGQKLSMQLRRYPRLFSPLSAQMIGVGEETGTLSDTLLYVSQMHEEEIEEVTRNLTTMLEPLLMIVMGLVVGFIAISIIEPIYGITQTLTPS